MSNNLMIVSGSTAATSWAFSAPEMVQMLSALIFAGFTLYKWYKLYKEDK